MNKISSITILEEYLNFIKDNSTVKEFKEGFYYSFPFLYSGDHFIELFVQQLGENLFAISDLGNVLMELRASGLEVLYQKKRKGLLYSILKKFDLGLDGMTIQKSSSKKDLIPTIHNFIEAIKAISDLMYFHEVKVTEKSVIYQEVKHILDHKRVRYLEGIEAKVQGKLDEHIVDFLIQNEHQDAIVTFSGENTKLLAELWGFRFSDIKELNENIKTISIYDVEESKWSETSKRILNAKSDFFIPSTEIERIEKLI